jgi:hypothetical protein
MWATVRLDSDVLYIPLVPDLVLEPVELVR